MHTIDNGHFRSEPMLGAEGTDYEGFMAYAVCPAGAKFYKVRLFDGMTELHDLNCYVDNLETALKICKEFTTGEVTQ